MFAESYCIENLREMSVAFAMLATVVPVHASWQARARMVLRRSPLKKKKSRVRACLRSWLSYFTPLIRDEDRGKF